MSIVTSCGKQTNEADCSYCLQIKECRPAREAICQGCKRELMCPVDFKHKRVDAGFCRGRELAIVDEITRLHGRGF
jgi:hypothetical protein